MPPTISDFRAISTGTHNVGDVLLDNEKGGLKKVNNFVSRWRVERNTVVASAQENMAVRKALYDALLVDGRVSKPVMDAIKNQLLGENGVRALKRDEVAVYIAAADTNSAEGLDDRIKELRERKIGDAGNRPLALKSKTDVAMKLSVNEKLDMARMELQKARVECEDILLTRHSGKPVADMIDKFATTFKKLCDDFARAMTRDGGEPNMAGLNLELAEDDFANHQTMCEAMCSIIDTLMLGGDAEGVESEPIRRELKSAFTFGSVKGLAPSTAVRVALAAERCQESLIENAPVDVSGLHYENHDVNEAVPAFMQQYFQLRLDALKYDRDRGIDTKLQNDSFIDVGRGITMKVGDTVLCDKNTVSDSDRTGVLTQRTQKGVDDWFEKASGTPQNKQLAKKLYIDFAYQQTMGVFWNACLRLGEPIPNMFTNIPLAQNYSIAQDSNGDFVFTFNLESNLCVTKCHVDGRGDVAVMSDARTSEQSKHNFDFSFKLSFDGDKPTLAPISVNHTLDMPNDVRLMEVNRPERYVEFHAQQPAEAPRAHAPAAAQTNTIIEGGFAGKTLEVSGVNTEAARYMQNELQAEAMTIKEEIANGTPLDDKQMYRDAGRDAILRFNGEVISQPSEYGDLQGLQDGEKRAAMKPMSDRLDACFSNDPNGEFARRFFRKLSHQNMLGMCLEALEKQYGVYTAPDNLPRKGDPKPVVVYEMKSLENGGYEYSVEYRGRPKVLDVNHTGVTINPDGGEMSYRMDLELTFDDKGNPNIRTTGCRSRIYVPLDVQPEIGEEFVDEAQKECLWGSPIGSPRAQLEEIRQNDLKELQNVFPITAADYDEALEEANRIKDTLNDLGDRFSNVRNECDLMIKEVDARIEELGRNKAARPQSYRNVREGLRMWCQAARYAYANALKAKEGPDAVPKPALTGELYMEMAAFDGVKDLDADCPKARKLLDDGLEKLANRLVRVLKREGIKMDFDTARREMQTQFYQLRDLSDDWRELQSEIRLTNNGGELLVKSTAVPAHLLDGNAKYAEHPDEKKGVNCTTFTGGRAVNAWQSTFEVGEKKFVGMRHGVNCAIREKNDTKRRECNLARAEEVFVDAALSSDLVRNAKDGETVTLDMTSVSLLTPDEFRGRNPGAINNERQMLAEQTEAWLKLEERYSTITQGLELSLPTADGGAKTVRVQLRLTPFNFGVNTGAVGHAPDDLAGGWSESDKINSKSIEYLGWRVEEFLEQHPESEYREAVRTLFNQIQDILARKGERHDEHNAYKVPMRINVLMSLMNGIPAWNCKSGKDRTGALEVWTQLLFQRIVSGQGVPDPNDPPTEDDVQNFRKLANLGNNFRIQKANTGFGGFKTKGVKSFKEILGGEEALNNYLAMSELVNE